MKDRIYRSYPMLPRHPRAQLLALLWRRLARESRRDTAGLRRDTRTT